MSKHETSEEDKEHNIAQIPQLGVNSKLSFCTLTYNATHLWGQGH